MLIASLSTSLSAGTIGLSYSATTIDGNGTEYVVDGATTNSNTGSNSEDVNIGSIFVETDTLEYGVRLGLEVIPGAAEFINKSTTQTNITSITSGTETLTQLVKGEFKNHLTLYVEKDLYSAVYLKGGLTSVDVKSLESIGTGSQYGDTSILGYVAGVGVRKQFDSGLLLKAEVAYNDYETIKLSSTNTSNRVEGDLDSVSGKISVGYNF